jgi:hypothetical protein
VHLVDVAGSVDVADTKAITFPILVSYDRNGKVLGLVIPICGVISFKLSNFGGI